MLVLHVQVVMKRLRARLAPLLRTASALTLIFGALFLPVRPAAADPEDYANPDRPGIADGSNVVGPGRFQIETGIQQEFRHADGTGDRRIFVPSLLRLGLTEELEARVETNAYTWERTSDPSTSVARTEGGTPISLGLKYHFQDSDGISQPSVATILRVFAPSGSGDFRTRHATGDFRFAADWDFAPSFSLNPNIGLGIYEGADGRLFTAGLFAATLNYNPSKQLNLFVDTGVQSPEERNGATSVIYDAGIAYLINPDVQLDLSVGTGGGGRTTPHPFLSAGISKRF
jgi:hypothetical protein